MKDIQPRFATDVAFIAVDIGDRQDLKELHAFGQEQDYPWSVGRAGRETLKTLDVIVQSTKVAIDTDGVIVYRAGYGEGTSKDWTSVFEMLSKVTPGT